MTDNLGAIAQRFAETDRVAYVDMTNPAPPGARLPEAREIGFAEFEDRSARIAGGLVARGLGRGDRIGILADNSVDYGACYLGIPRVAMVTVPLNTRQPVDTLSVVAADADMALVIHDQANADRLPPGVPAVEIGSEAWVALTSAQPAAVVDVDGDDVAIQMYTSGSTGRPKGVLLSHGGQLFSIDQYVNGVMPIDPDERLMVSAPMYHKNAGMQLKMALSLGGTVILCPRFDAELYLTTVAAQRATAVSGVPTMFALMAARADLISTLDLSSVQRASIGSAPMTEALFEQARQLFPNAMVTNGYGTTEVVAVFGGHPDGLDRPAITVGHPLAAVETRLVDAAGSDVEADADGERQGELWVRSPGLMVGYHQLAETTAERVTDGWYHTGDVMTADADGWHYFVGRVDDMFNSGGENIYPGDVEQMLERCPSLHQACVVSVTDELKGALPVAFVVAAVGHQVDEEAVKQWALANGPAYQHPRAVWFVDLLPLAGTAKIDRSTLVAEAARRWIPR